jgi:site-specific DNA recombinase
MRVAAYARVSMDRQHLAQTIQQQVDLLRAYVRRQPEWALDEAHLFRDGGYSGARLQRPGLDALRDQVARAAFDVVVLAAPDRLARHFVHQMVVLDEWERAGIQVVFIDRPPSRDPHEQLVTQIRGAVAEYERTLIADRMRRGRLAKLRAGQLLPWTSHVPYGYRVDPERPRDPALVTTDPYAAGIVQGMFATYADGSATLHSLAEALTRRGVPTPTGLRLWSPATLHGILTNPASIGQAVAQRYQTRTPQQRHSPLLPIGRTRERHSSPSRPREEWIIVPIPALVPAAHFVAAQQRLVHNRLVARRNLKHTYLLQGLVSCGHCRRCCFVRARGRAVAPGERQYHSYLCRGKQAAVTSRHEQPCPSRFIPAAELDALVWADLCTVLQTPEILAGALQRARTGAWLPSSAVSSTHATTVRLWTSSPPHRAWTTRIATLLPPALACGRAGARSTDNFPPRARPAAAAAGAATVIRSWTRPSQLGSRARSTEVISTCFARPPDEGASFSRPSMPAGASRLVRSRARALPRAPADSRVLLQRVSRFPQIPADSRRFPAPLVHRLVHHAPRGEHDGVPTPLKAPGRGCPWRHGAARPCVPLGAIAAPRGTPTTTRCSPPPPTGRAASATCCASTRR